jgi:hypothetical protein
VERALTEAVMCEAVALSSGDQRESGSSELAGQGIPAGHTGPQFHGSGEIF